MIRMGMVALVVAAGLVAGCGGDDDDASGSERLGKEEFADRMTEINSRVEGEFQKAFGAMSELRENERLSEEARAGLRDAARVEREALEELEGLEPPEDAEQAVDDLVEAGTEQADALEQAAGDQSTTVRDVADSFERAPIGAPLSELEQKGYLPEGASQGG